MGLSAQRTVYVVDDEQVIASTLALILKQHGYKALPFFDPLAVVDASASESPDFLISDVVMPQMTGVDLAITMSEQHPRCKVVMFSGQAATSLILDEARQKGFEFQVLAKPIHTRVLLNHLDQLSQ